MTDIHEAVIGKAGGEKVQQERRSLKRLAGQMVGQASDLTSDKIDLMHIALGMQTACQMDNADFNGVLKAFRMGGWLAHRPTPHGLVPYVGPDWRNYPLGSSLLSPDVTQKRMAMVPLNGKPAKPDWKELRDLRRMQRKTYVRRRRKISEDFAANLYTKPLPGANRF